MKKILFFICFAISVSTLQAQNHNVLPGIDPNFEMDTVDDYNMPWPAWVFSHWIWEGEGTTQSATQIADDYLAHDIPVGAIIIDSPWETGYNTMVFEDSLYPNAQGMIDNFHSKNIKVLLWITGIVNVDVQPLYDSLATLDYFMKPNSGSGPGVVEWWKGDGSLIDWYNPDAVAWWKGLMDNVLDMGIDGWKCDGTDYYAVQNTYSPAAGTVTRLDYSHQYYQLFHDYTREQLGDKRVNMSRPIDNYDLLDLGGDFFSFTPKDICWACWVGDQDGSYDGMKAALNNMYYSDEYDYMAFGSDIGGYRSDMIAYPGLGRSKELFIRWTQLGALSPLMENGGGGEHRPWMFDDETTNIYRRFAKFHTSLMPYLMAEAQTAYNNEVSMMSFFNKTDYSFMLGSDIFVAPILADGGNVTVNFPAGDNWVYLFDTTIVKTGGSSEALTFPLSEFPVYVRQGSTYEISEPGLSVQSDKAELNVSLYPNPASDNIMVQLNEQVQVADCEVRIMNTLGQEVFSKALTSNRETIDISTFASGIYYLKLESSKGVAVKKFEVMK